jgi:hypothetical protein
MTCKSKPFKFGELNPKPLILFFERKFEKRFRKRLCQDHSPNLVSHFGKLLHKNDSHQLLFYEKQLVWPVPLAQVLVTTFSTDFSFQNLVFWNLFEFSVAEITYKKNISHILNPNLTK